jgi:hypothetical protein
MTVKRFTYIRSSRGRVLHIFFYPPFSEGQPTVCGLRVEKGWQYGPRWKSKIKAVCKRCQK